MSIQISAEISESTRELLEYYVKATGIKKGFLIEQAVLNYIRALNELPSDLLVPARIVLGPESASRVVKHVFRPPKPTVKLRKLMTE